MARSPARTARKPGRRPMTKEMLLPLAVSKVRELSLENHLRLAAIRSGHGSQSVVMNLLRVLYLGFFMLDDTHRQCDFDVFREGSCIMPRCSAARATSGMDASRRTRRA